MVNISVFGLLALVVFIIIVLVALFGRSASNGRGWIVALSVSALVGIPLVMITFGLFFVRSSHESDLSMVEKRVVETLHGTGMTRVTNVQEFEATPSGLDRATVEVLPGQFRVIHPGRNGESKRSSTIVILRSQAGFPVIEIVNDEEAAPARQSSLPVLATDHGISEPREDLAISPAEGSDAQSAERRIELPADSASHGLIGQSVRSNSQAAVTIGTQPPAWVTLGGTAEDEFGSQVTVSSRPRLNLDEAKADAWAKVVEVLEQEFRRQNPQAENWDLPETLVVHDEVILDEFDQIYLAEMTDGLKTPTHIMHYRVDRSTEALAKIRPYCQSELVNDRLRGLGGVVTVITFCLAGVFAYLRYETRPDRCARKRLAVAVAMALAVVLAAAIRFLR